MCCVLITIHDENHEESDHENPLLHAPFLLFHNSSTVSVVFDFIASMSEVIPLSPIQLSVDLMRIEKSGLLMDVICVLFLLSSQLR